MTKYTMDFKLEVIDHYLTGHSYHSTANSFGIKRSIVQNWVRLYQTHGIDGIRTRVSKASYSPEFKHTAVLQLLVGKSMSTVATKLNISSPSVLFQWLKAYQTHGIMGLTPKPKGRKAMTSSTNKKAKANQTSTNEHAELLRRIQYLEAENAYLKKLDALIRQKNQSKSKTKS